MSGAGDPMKLFAAANEAWKERRPELWGDGAVAEVFDSYASALATFPGADLIVCGTLSAGPALCVAEAAGVALASALRCVVLRAGNESRRCSLFVARSRPTRPPAVVGLQPPASREYPSPFAPLWCASRAAQALLPCVGRVNMATHIVVGHAFFGQFAPAWCAPSFSALSVRVPSSLPAFIHASLCLLCVRASRSSGLRSGPASGCPPCPTTLRRAVTLSATRNSSRPSRSCTATRGCACRGESCQRTRPLPPFWAGSCCPSQRRADAAPSLPPKLAEWLAACAAADEALPAKQRKRLISVGFGSMPFAGGTAQLRRLVAAACAKSKCCAVLLSGWTDAASKATACASEDDTLISQHVFVCESVAHAALFPLCSVVVHHAGAGTLAAALAAGVPQVPVPFLFEQCGWASRPAPSRGGRSPPRPSRRRCAAPRRRASQKPPRRWRARARRVERGAASDGGRRAGGQAARGVDARRRGREHAHPLRAPRPPIGGSVRAHY